MPETFLCISVGPKLANYKLTAFHESNVGVLKSTDCLPIL